MEHATFRKTVLPSIIAVIMLVLFNAGLYFRLSAVEIVEPTDISFPYTDTFETDAILSQPNFGGDWDIRDETLVQISTTGFDLGLIVPLGIAPEQAYQYSVDMRYIGGSMGGGMIFNSQNGRNRQQSHMARFNVDAGELWVIYGYFGDDSNFTGQGSTQVAIAPESTEWQRLGVLVGADTYAITLNDAVIAENIPLEYQGGAIGLNTSSSQVAFDNLVVQAWDGSDTPTVVSDIPAEPVGTVTTDDLSDALVFDSFDISGDGASLWLPFSGAWEFRDGAFVQSQEEGFDLGAGYNAPVGDVNVTTTLRHLEGQGGGVLFNMATADSQFDAHMVRYVHDADFLFWGYFDVDGTFTGQGSIEVPSPADTAHTLQVINNGATYAIALDSELLAVDIPVVARGDYVGLVTAQSEVAFDDFTISDARATIAIPTTPIAEETPEADNDGQFNTVTGDWEFGETIFQRSDEAVDYVAGTGIAAETFTVSVMIDLSEAPEDAGAGLIFHMSERENIANGQMIRFGNGGTEIFWGTYDANGVFEGAGGIPLNGIDWTEPHELTLNVGTDTYDVLIDGAVMVSDLPVEGTFGYLGLLSYRGTVAFSDFELSIGR
ncbi:MAG: hypothetical protein AAFR81_16030 [Chloroflexota bacterium]